MSLPYRCNPAEHAHLIALPREEQVLASETAVELVCEAIQSKASPLRGRK
jgi:hypothetical protein